MQLNGKLHIFMAQLQDMEKRVFKEQLTPAFKTIYAIAAAACITCAWFKLILLAVTAAVVLLLITDRLLKGEYVLETKVLTLRRGRFAKEKAMLIENIENVETRKGLDAFIGTIAIGHLGRKRILNPENPESFAQALAKRMQQAKAEHEQNSNTNNNT